MNLLGKNIVVYDLETEHPIGGDIGWGDYEKMGVSVGCLYDYKDNENKVYFKEDLPKLTERLNSADLIVGHYTTGFDNKLIRGLGHALRPDDNLPNFDLCIESRIAAGFPPVGGRVAGFKLDDHLRETFGPHMLKTEDGAMAPVLWQAGERGRVVTYCLGDVKREKMVFEHMVMKGWIATTAHGRKFVDISRVKAACGVK